MCRRVTCKRCGKPSWAGCGAHVDKVLADVPKADRCRCNEPGYRAPAKASATKGRPAAEPAATTPVGRFRDWLKK
ncbi:MAG: hypothetical protein Q7V88_15385 [Actinomycetota bacterium]|nr:hypothetical protein [Actinomycetota bacterium]